MLQFLKQEAVVSTQSTGGMLTFRANVLCRLRCRSLPRLRAKDRLNKVSSVFPLSGRRYLSGNSTESSRKPTLLSEYKPPAYLVSKIELTFNLESESRVVVHSKLQITRNSLVGSSSKSLFLDGKRLTLKSLSLDGNLLCEGRDYEVTSEGLLVHEVPTSFTVQIETEIDPKANTELNGLYNSGGNFCTQCEPEGFRRITYMIDRPDVMAKYTTTVVADKTLYPVILSNGNLVASGVYDSDHTKHFATWDDPWPKPTYLFALVAGDFFELRDTFTTKSGNPVDLSVYVQHHNRDQCSHAMGSLKKAMKWDEDTYGREYDLNKFMIVAVDDFNMGAMENKGLNIFNSKYVLAHSLSSTDRDFENILGVVGHEYFHNWSGNRVTCRDWFQLSLKEGFTVFRDQEFSSDMTSRGYKRIDDVMILRASQFVEDSSPIAHPVQPQRYYEINNFYTATVYNKGAEVVRMLSSLLGKEGFRRGTDLYFSRYDGQAVTVEDFVKALSDANESMGVDLDQFMLWYSQAGTPKVTVSTSFNAVGRTFSLKVIQECPPTPGQEVKQPFHIPFTMSLFDEKGLQLPLVMPGEDIQQPIDQGKEGSGGGGSGFLERTLHIRDKQQEFVFKDIPSKPIPSLLRGFSAPVQLVMEQSDEDLGFLMSHDNDSFNQWEAGQKLALNVLKGRISSENFGTNLSSDAEQILRNAFEKALKGSSRDPASLAQTLTLPSLSYMSTIIKPVRPLEIFNARMSLIQALAKDLEDILEETYHHYNHSDSTVGERALKNTCLGYMMEIPNTNGRIKDLCINQYTKATNMTDTVAALVALSNKNYSETPIIISEFHEKWKNNSLVVDKWLSIQAMSRLPDTLDRVVELLSHPSFNIKNPNKVRALVGAFTANSENFHEISGKGYQFLSERIIEIDSFNPQISAGLARSFLRWKEFSEPHSGLMLQFLKQISKKEGGLSKNLDEIVSNALLVSHE
eukprot:TRINITY_DN11455_c0_g2_i3.p1 TRINITY_DN11455_c0_g2~~TRINITY_DN11455_c0_g2_i3.p1  ORF type:complete len:968 (-),score=215.84 TRINITY_DN11455_c0_g2_i3:228-3131(-)